MNGKHAKIAISISGVVTIGACVAIAGMIWRGGRMGEKINQHEKFIEKEARPAVQKVYVLEKELEGICKQLDRIEKKLP